METHVHIIVFILFAALSLSFNFNRRIRRLDDMKVRIAKLQLASNEQSNYIRVIAKETLGLRRLHKSKLSIRCNIFDQCEEMKSLLDNMNKIDCRLHVLDDRKTVNDKSWIAVIKHSNFKETVFQDAAIELDKQWKIGFRYIIWAPDKDRAIDKINRIYKPDAAYFLSSIEQFTE